MDKTTNLHYKNISLKDIEGEIWLPIELTPNYLASNFGRVKSISRLKDRGIKGNCITKDTILKQALQKNGYLTLSICANNKVYNKLVHILVAKAFILNIENKPDVNHIRGIKTDNRASELEWVTKSENTLHAISTGLMKVRTGKDNHMFGKIKGLHHGSKRITQLSKSNEIICKYDSMIEAYEKTKIQKQNISKVCRGIRQMAGGYFWEYSLG